METTTIYVTHDQVEAMTMGDRVAVMRHGELQQVDGPQRLFDSPSNLFVASFIGSPPMNLVEARIDARNGELTASFGGQELTIPDEVVTRRPDCAITSDVRSHSAFGRTRSRMRRLRAERTGAACGGGCS